MCHETIVDICHSNLRLLPSVLPTPSYSPPPARDTYCDRISPLPCRRGCISGLFVLSSSKSFLVLGSVTESAPVGCTLCSGDIEQEQSDGDETVLELPVTTIVYRQQQPESSRRQQRKHDHDNYREQRDASTKSSVIVTNRKCGGRRQWWR